METNKLQLLKCSSANKLYGVSTYKYELMSFEIVNIEGKLVMSGNVVNNKIAVNSLIKGNYWIKFKSDDLEFKALPFMIQ